MGLSLKSDSLLERTKECINNGSNLIIWPEAALPFHSIQNKNTLEYINNKLLKIRDSINKPLTLSEKNLYLHCDNSKNKYNRGIDYVK